MKKIIVASTNPVKINAALEGFQKMFPDEPFAVAGISVPSSVSNQPNGDAETFTGARNRAANAHAAEPDADFWVGIEGGIENKDSGIIAFAWMVIQGKNGVEGKGRTSTFFLPPAIATLVNQGKELGEASDILFHKTNIKKENGALGILTNNVTDRTKYYTEAIILALIPFKNPELF